MKKVDMKVIAGAAKRLKSLASTTRMGIMAVLTKNGATSVMDIAANMDMTHSAISHQLAVLTGYGIVTSKKKGRLMMYSIPKGSAGAKLVKFLGI